MPRPTTKAKTGRPPTGRVKALISLEPEQLAALREEAFRRAAAHLRGRPDLSGVVRELVSAWMRKRPPRALHPALHPGAQAPKRQR